MTHTRALLLARLQSARNQLRHEPFAALQGVVIVGALVAAAAALGWSSTQALARESASLEAAWVVLRERVFLGVALQCFAVSYVAMDALLRPPDGAVLLALPIGPAPRFLAALLNALARTIVLPVCLVGFVAPLWAQPDALGEVLFARATGLVLGAYLLALWAGFGLGALAGGAAASVSLRGVKQALSGNWVAADRAPLLYAPGVGGGLAAFLSVPLQTSLDAWPSDPPALYIGAALVMGAGLCALLVGAYAYLRGFARIAPILESVDARYPMSASTADDGEDAPYGSAVAAWTPGLAGAVAARDLAGVRRRHRAEPLLGVALGIGAALALDRLEASAAVTNVVATLVGLIGARVGVLLTRADFEVPWLQRALGVSWRALFGGKVAIALFHAAHASVVFASVSALSGRTSAGVLCVAVAVLAAIAGPALGMAFGGARATLPALGAAAGVLLLVALDPWRVALPALGGLTLLAISQARRAAQPGVLA